ncbi:MAG: aminotransferase class I/II-fold pyridoxal phosphate-dependent enzyme [Clostridiales bacterium]|nr:aminotransferase class I/II-fold pyridoxal phosphate-dependent enzyme [Clostridiales bacterium]
MKAYTEMTRNELLEEQALLQAEYRELCAMDLHLDMSRGKPSAEQLDLSMPMMDVLTSKTPLKSRKGTDLRNYGVLDGIDEAKELIAAMIDTQPENVIVYGNASLHIMYEAIGNAMMHGILGSTPWVKLDSVKFLCPVPGYDRHFTITESFGIEMINVPLTETGPDMDMVEEYVNNDESVKGIWCVPKYSNPTGISYSDEVVQRFANLKPAASDFRIFWDNAYCVHHIYPEQKDEILDIISACEEAGNPDMVYEFCSTSKITFSGAGISGMATSPRNKEEMLKHLTVKTIGFDKINQLRHVKFLKDMDGVEALMAKQAALVRPKFELWIDRFEKELSDLDVGSWTHPRGGYFLTYVSNEGCAKNIIELAQQAGVVMTGAGAPYPYKKDPRDTVIRIAPTLPPMDELDQACTVFITCVKLASIKKLLENATNL